jgi:hypothetical protein
VGKPWNSVTVCIAVRLVVDHRDPVPGSAQHECGGEAGGPTTDHDHVHDADTSATGAWWAWGTMRRVCAVTGPARQLGECDHRGGEGECGAIHSAVCIESTKAVRATSAI